MLHGIHNGTNKSNHIIEETYKFKKTHNDYLAIAKSPVSLFLGTGYSRIQWDAQWMVLYL